MRVLVDTNVVIDVLQRREPHFADSHAVVVSCARGNVEGWFCAKAITDVFDIMHRHFHDNEPCLDMVRKLYKLFRVANTTAASCLQAAFSLVGDYEDAIVDETAKGIGANYIVTRNVGDFKNSTVPAITPSGLMELVG
jgi:predicted nucleic acid-binding protein